MTHTALVLTFLGFILGFILGVILVTSKSPNRYISTSQ